MNKPIYNTYSNFKYNDETNQIEGYSSDDIKEIQSNINSQIVVVLKNVFAKDEMKEIRRLSFDYMCENESRNPQIEADLPNFFRRDENPELSAVKRVKQFYTSFYWNKALGNEVNYMKAMTLLRNKLAGLPEKYTIDGVEEDGYMTYSNITHYPSGAGKLNKHKDPPNKQYAVIISSLSEKRSDFESGGFYVEVDGVKHNLEEELEIGDVYLMQPQMIHGVDTIDPQVNKVNWEDPKGRWILFPALIEVKTLKGIKVEGLEDLGNDN